MPRTAFISTVVIRTFHLENTKVSFRIFLPFSDKVLKAIETLFSIMQLNHLFTVIKTLPEKLEKMVLCPNLMNLNRIQSLKYLRSTTFGCRDIGIRKSEFVSKTQFL